MLDLSEFDTQSIELDLSVFATKISDGAIRVETCQVACFVEPSVAFSLSPFRVANEGFGGLFFIM